MGHTASAGLLAAARGGDEDAFARLVEPHRRELQAHAYRMLGSVHDAEDALQDAMLRAWRGLPRFDGSAGTGSTLRAWLYKIATNTCLDGIAQRKRRGLPIDLLPAADLGEAPGRPLVESVWLEPLPVVPRPRGAAGVPRDGAALGPLRMQARGLKRELATRDRRVHVAQGRRCYRPFALDVLTIRADRIEQVTSFIARPAQAPEGRGFDDYPDHPVDAWRVADFERFGLPARMD